MHRVIPLTFVHPTGQSLAFRGPMDGVRLPRASFQCTVLATLPAAAGRAGSGATEHSDSIWRANYIRQPQRSAARTCLLQNICCKYGISLAARKAGSIIEASQKLWAALEMQQTPPSGLGHWKDG